MRTINIAKEFSRYPAGRFMSDGPYSGEQFREDYLRPILEKNERATIELDGTRGYGHSFLEEAFGGLVRSGISAQRVKQAFIFVSNDQTLIVEILECIDPTFLHLND